MNPVVLFFVSGDALYLGVGLLFVAVATSYSKRKWLRRNRNLSAFAALAIMVMASPPFPYALDAIFLAVFALWFIAWNRSVLTQIWARIRLFATAILALLSLLLPATEWTHRTMPRIVGPSGDHLVVIGDSISSGIDLRVPTWPALMTQMTGVPVRNLARPGANTVAALSMARQIAVEDRIVLLEIGGNDMLSGVPSAEFAKALDDLLSNVVAPGRTVAMFELPLLPGRIGYGQVQRRLAAKYGVWLIPKRCFAEVISGASATSDGLHLSEAGARRMATLVAQVLTPVLKMPPQ